MQSDRGGNSHGSRGGSSGTGGVVRVGDMTVQC